MVSVHFEYIFVVRSDREMSPHGASCLESMVNLVLLKSKVAGLFIVLILETCKEIGQNSGA